MEDSLTRAVEELRGKIIEQVALLQQNPAWAEVQRLYTGLGVLEQLCGSPKTELSALLGIASNEGPKIGKYEFAGQLPLEAAKQYLRKIAPAQKAASLDDIVSALSLGGLKSLNRDELRISLSRSTMEIYKADEDIYGLVENFPHIRRGTPGRKKAVIAPSAGGQSGSVTTDTSNGGTEP